MKKKPINQVLLLGIFVVLMELIYHILIFHKIFNLHLLYIILFSLFFVVTISFIRLLPRIVNKVIFFIITSFLTLYFMFQYCFHIMFSNPFSFATIGLANQAMDFWDVTFRVMGAHWWQLLLLLLPLIIVIVLSRFTDFKTISFKNAFIWFGVFLISYGVTILSLLINKKEMYSAYELYYNVNSTIDNYDTFGVITGTRLDLKRLAFGFEEKISNPVVIDQDTNNPVVTDPLVINYGDNVLDIDFQTLIDNTKNNNLKEIHTYFSSVNPTNKNEYTGYYKGKNLIFVLAEGFNEIAVSEELTPTLYKMSNNSFVFNNFYSPVYLSTIGGEFQATTGLIPNQEILTNWKKNMVTNSFALGHMFSNSNYQVQSYHDWTYTYYGRNKYMKNLGYENYTGCNNGLEKKISCKWLPSDTDMIKVTVDDYIGAENFMTYYVTVSGHSPYVLTNGNSTALKYKDYVKDLNYSTSVKAYLASQIELDRAMEELLKTLEEKGILDDTVIVLVGDHYPYTLSTDEINEVSSYKKDGIVEVNHSKLIIYNSTTPRIEINKVGSQIDVLPTVLNLFGMDYDSRLLIGKDILADNEGLAIFSNRSWVSDSGTYFSGSRKFVPKEGVTVSSDYVNNMNKLVANNFTMSKYLINYDYYRLVLGSEQ